ncbi:hypothetical protein KNU51_gp21 [Pseudomonas phage vB_Pae_BR319a]|uniref:Uncharacterized protein n=1 Tax=Pseudomonas phage vB_Pae_BR319a TaxID=2563525 RepID=A0A481V699_9CAUD|nr:hypothetical protein KNU51_gp21 [Pseudomonas phage vB_Pae_BR319a]QBI84129.1 hypothetical protein [Pseudomonas phage vB_Pae_BR319a]
MTLHRLPRARRWGEAGSLYGVKLQDAICEEGFEPVRCGRPVFCERKLTGLRPVAQLAAVRLQRLVLLSAERRGTNLELVAVTCDQGVGVVELAVAPIALDRCQSLVSERWWWRGDRLSILASDDQQSLALSVEQCLVLFIRQRPKLRFRWHLFTMYLWRVKAASLRAIKEHVPPQ